MKIFIVCLLVLVNLQANSEKYLNMFKEYSMQGKNVIIEQTLLNGINALVDTTKIKINSFDIEDKTNKIKISIFLKGEDKDLQIDIDKFQWGVTEDKRYIVFENFDIDLNIDWMQYVVDDIAKRDRGYIKVPHSVALFSLLYTIKPNIKSTYKFFDKEPFIISEYPFDKRYLKIEELELNQNKIAANIWLKGSKQNLKIDVESYILATANNRQLIVLKDIKFKEFTKPWIQSIIEKQHNEVHLKYTEKLYNLLNTKDLK